MKDINVYKCKDGRTRAYIKETKKVISYPRLLLEEKIGRELYKNEQVHHIDGNPLNNNIDNLEVSLLGEHQRYHSPSKYFDIVAVCAWCGKEFTWTAVQQRRHYGNRNRRREVGKPFCSKSCSGTYGTYIQNMSKNAGVAK